MSEVVCYKLTNGQDIVGKFDIEKQEILSNYLVLEEALLFNIQVVADEQGNKSVHVGFAPVSAVCKGQGAARVELRHDSIFMRVELDPSYEDGYLQVVSPIQLLSTPGRIIK